MFFNYENVLGYEMYLKITTSLKAEAQEYEDQYLLEITMKESKKIVHSIVTNERGLVMALFRLGELSADKEELKKKLYNERESPNNRNSI